MPALDISAHTAPLLVTVAYLGLYYAFQVNLLRVKGRLTKEYAARGEKFDRYFGQDRQMLAADRYQLNMLEHMPPFLTLMWLDALFVGPLGAGIAGGIYVAARALYPLMMGTRLGRQPRLTIMLVTGPGYAVLLYFMGALAWGICAPATT